MMLRQQLQEEIKQAMRDKSSLKLDALRYLWSEIKNAEIDAKVELGDDGVQAIVVKEVKRRKEAIEQMEGAGRDMGEEKEKLGFIEAYLPELMSREEIGLLVDQLISELDGKDFGKVMGALMPRIRGKADGKLVQEVVREKLK